MINAIKGINVFKALVAISILNCLDAFLTLFWIQNGLASEANPIMNEALMYGAFNFFIIKISLVSFGCLGLWRARERLFSKIAIFACLFFYGVLLLYHGYGFYLGVFNNQL